MIAGMFVDDEDEDEVDEVKQGEEGTVRFLPLTVHPYKCINA